MKIFFKRKSTIVESSSYHQRRSTVDFENLPADHGQRPPIWSYDANDRDRVRMTYLLKGHSQPLHHDFPRTEMYKLDRKFVAKWFVEYPDWLEYSITKDSVFCLYCYLFKTPLIKGGGDSFVGEGFRNWRKKEKFDHHIGKPNSLHNEAKMKCNDLMNQGLTRSVSALFSGKSSKDRVDCRTRLDAAVDVVRIVLKQGLAFRGHDESHISANRGNYLELFHCLAKHDERVQRVAFENAPQNCQLTSSDIQKDICFATATETTCVIIKEIGDAFYTLLVDESRDVSMKEQMAISVRYVNKDGEIQECFLGIKHVSSTTGASLKGAIDKFFSIHGLSISKLRGQGYDGGEQ